MSDDIDVFSIDLTLYEPFKLDEASVIIDLKQFFTSHKSSYYALKKANKHRLAKAYSDRASKVKKAIVAQLKQEKPHLFNDDFDDGEAYARFSKSQRGFSMRE
jgi:hypothetical protein